MLGTTGTVTRRVKVQDVKHVSGQARVEGEHEELVTEACIVVGELADGKLQVVVFGSDGVSSGRAVDEDDYYPAGALEPAPAPAAGEGG